MCFLTFKSRVWKSEGPAVASMRKNFSLLFCAPYTRYDVMMASATHPWQSPLPLLWCYYIPRSAFQRFGGGHGWKIFIQWHLSFRHLRGGWALKLWPFELLRSLKQVLGRIFWSASQSSFTLPHLLLRLPLICSTMLPLPVLSELPTTPSSSSAEVTMSSDVLA